MKHKEISSFYTLKAIAAFLVVCCHVPTWMSSYYILDTAVPCFFIITGYFLYKDDEFVMSFSSLLKKLKQLLLVLICLTVVYYIIEPKPIDIFDYPVIVRWIFVSIPNKFGGPLWYLTSMIWGLIAFWGYMKLTKGRYVGLLICLTVIGLIIGKYRFLFDSQPSSYFVFNFINYALPCFSIGYLLHKHELRIINNPYLIDVSILCVFSFLLEMNLLKEYSNGLSQMGPSILIYPTCASIIALTLKYKEFGQNSILEKIGKEYSSNIYYWHMVFVWILSYLEGSALPNRPYWAVLVFGLSIIFSHFVIYIQRKIGVSVFG